jgi:hypothetical protein
VRAIRGLNSAFVRISRFQRITLVRNRLISARSENPVKSESPLPHQLSYFAAMRYRTSFAELSANWRSPFCISRKVSFDSVWSQAHWKRVTETPYRQWRSANLASRSLGHPRLHRLDGVLSIGDANRGSFHRRCESGLLDVQLAEA